METFALELSSPLIPNKYIDGPRKISKLRSSSDIPSYPKQMWDYQKQELVLALARQFLALFSIK